MAALRAIGSIVGMQIFGAGAGFLVVLVLTAALGAEGYGRYAWVISMAGVGALLLQRGLPTTLVKRFAPLDLGKVTPPSPLANTLALYTALAVLGGILVFPVMAVLPTLGIARAELAWALPIGTALACLAIADAILRAAERGVLAQFASQILRAGGLLAGAVLLAFSGIETPQAYLSVYALTAMAAALIFTWRLVAMAVQSPRGGLVASTSAHFQVSLSRSIGNHLPIFITGFFVAPETLAYLAIAVRLTGPIQFGVIASRAHFGARINRHVKAGALDRAKHEYRLARLYALAVGVAATLGVLGLMAVLAQWRDGPFAEFSDTTLMLTLFAMAAGFRLSLAAVGPGQLVAILLGADDYVRKLNLAMLAFLAGGLVLAGALDMIHLSAIVLLLYGAILAGGLAWKITGLFRNTPPRSET